MIDSLIQPIETAPTTTPSPWLLLFDWDWQIGWWHPVLGWVAPSDDGYRPITPTHWRPLPPDPESQLPPS